MNDKIVRAVFNPSETDHMLRCVDLALASAKRAYNTTKQPDFKPIFEKNMNELQALKLKISGLTN
jgi:hypothetical protein